MTQSELILEIVSTIKDHGFMFDFYRQKDEVVLKLFDSSGALSMGYRLKGFIYSDLARQLKDLGRSSQPSLPMENGVFRENAVG